MTQPDWSDTPGNEAHPIAGRSRVEFDAPPSEQHGQETHFRAVSDEGANAAAALAASAETRIASLTNQLMAATTLNAAISGTVLTLSGSPSRELAYGIAAVLLVAGLAFVLIALRIDAALRYYYTLASSATFVVRKHYRIGIVHRDADQAYASAMFGLHRILGKHSYRLIAAVNFLLPAISALYLILIHKR